jgi:hypothetical protein
MRSEVSRALADALSLSPGDAQDVAHPISRVAQTS